MKSEVAIRVKDLSKVYKLYNRPSDRLREALHPFRKKYHREFAALKDINFEILNGETIGIVGLNGSGKSTLLQLLCGTLSASSGSIEVKGRIAALLELGAGFNPEFTGKENVYLYATLIGLKQEEIDAKYEEIVAFADIGSFIDQPVKAYSSGMYVRLAFAVAINVSPDILIVDEALAVGDMLFQAKCMIRLKQMMDRGTTVLFVSHDISAVKSLCTRCIFLNKGIMKGFGETADIVSKYIAEMHMGINETLNPVRNDVVKVASNPAVIGNNNLRSSAGPILVSTNSEMPFAKGSRRYGDFGARILDAKLINKIGVSADRLELHENFTIQFSVRFTRDMENYAVGYGIQDIKGLTLVGVLSSSYPDFKVPAAREGDVFIFEIKGVNILAQDIYTVTVCVENPVIVNEQHTYEDVVEHAIIFRSYFPSERTAWFPTKIWTPVEFTYAKSRE